MKTCPKCKVEKTRAEFHRQTSKPDGLRSWCKTCTLAHRAANRDPKKCRDARLRMLYGITAEQWEEARVSQQNACASCRDPFTTIPHTDHNHTTHAFRGLLCNGCNTSLGLLKESPARMHALADYIARH